jgi:protein phosphatase
MTRHPLPYAGGTDVGLVRSDNEDAYLVNPPLLAVADGLGGHLAGEVASSIAVETLLADAPRSADAKALARAVRTANAAVIEAADSGRGRFGMGTTLTAAMIDGTRIVLAHVGDSRAYLLHFGALAQVTHDHSMVADMVRNGTLTAEEARVHPNRSVITRALGSDPNLLVDTYEIEAAPGDRLLLCSDGLTGMVDDPEIERILSTATSAEEAVDRLIEGARDAGGQDNITVVVAQIGDAARHVSHAHREGQPIRESGPAPRASSARAWGARVLWLLVLLGIVAGATYGAYSYARVQAFVIDEGGRVAVYRGVPGTIGSVELRWREELTNVPVAALDPVTATRLGDGIRVEGIAAAYDLVARYRLETGVSPDAVGSVEPTSTP